MSQSTFTLLTIAGWTLDKVEAELAQIEERSPTHQAIRLGRVRSYVRAATAELHGARGSLTDQPSRAVEGTAQ